MKVFHCTRRHASLRKDGRCYELRLLRAGCRFWVAFVSILVSIALLVIVLHRDEENAHTSSTPSQPLVILRPNFLPLSEIEALKRHLPSHPLIIGNQLDEENFANTRGWVVKFNKEGIERFRSMPEMRDVVWYFDRVCDPHSNAFVMNALIVEQPLEGHKAAVGIHQDDTVAIKHQDDFLAHQVNVLYIQVPDEMNGGQLEVWPAEYEDSGQHKAIVYAEENLMVEFKGTAFHKVRGFHSPSGDARISLVLEQYRISRKYYGNLVPFCMNKDCDEMEIND